MPSGDPRKQERPDGRTPPDPAEAMVEAFPPTLSLAVTGVGAEVVPFPFVGGKAVDIQLSAGPFSVHGHVHPDVIDSVCEVLQQAKMKAQTSLSIGTMQEAEALAKAQGNGNGS